MEAEPAELGAAEVENSFNSDVEKEESPESIILSDDDGNDSDYEPQAKKKATKKAVVKKETVKKVPVKKERVKKERVKKERVKKEPVKKERVKKEPVKRKRAANAKAGTPSKKIKTETDALEVNQDGEVPANSNLCSSGTTEDIPPVNDAGTAKACDIEKIVSKAKANHQPWKDEEVVAETTNIPVYVARNIISLFNEDCTIPFIVRYRKEKTGGLQAEKLRDIQTSYEEVKLVHKKVENILKTVKSENFDESSASALLAAKTLEEVEFLYAPFKPGSKRTLAERSKQLGLESISLQLLETQIALPAINFSSYIKPNVKGLKNVEEIKTGIQYIIADTISKHREVLDFVRFMSNHSQIRILSTKSASAEKSDRQAHVEGKKTENFKYENYFNLNILIKHVAHHQVMAVNRGEKQKVLTVKIQIPFEVQRKIKDFIWNRFFSSKYLDPQTSDFLRLCVNDSHDRLIEPHICRQIRSDLTKKAEKESIAVFGSNVKSLLLTPPVRGKTVIGVDPGFSHGCKIAAISIKGEVLKTDVIYPHSKNKNKWDISDGLKLKDMISSFGAQIIAIGNGTACRETELWLSNLITSRFFQPLEVKYCIVNESGVSIYSVTKEAETELPNMDPNVRSAVAIARRLQDPLLEYVKIEPKHLGVGMYQHDVPEAQLKKALDGVVEECVSFVGVDLNVCPEFMLKKISGLNSAKAKHIIEWRNQHGSFANRKQLLEVKGLGPKSFEQCAGFVKIIPETTTLSEIKAEPSVQKKKKVAANENHKPNPLDRTIIHPESYEIAERFLNELKVSPEEVGTQVLVDKVRNHMRFTRTEDVAKNFNVAVPVMQLIVDAFKQLMDYDIRGEFDQPLFMTSVRKFSDLKSGQELTGRVMNVAGFGAFVDIGVEKSGLIHNSKMNGQVLSVGERVTVKVLSVEVEKKRIQLQLLKKRG